MSEEKENVEVSRRSEWSAFQYIVGTLGIVSGVVLIVLHVMDVLKFGTTPGVLAIFGGIQAIIFGFLIDVFTDIRWYNQKTAKLTERSEWYLQKIAHTLEQNRVS
jgi:hypothetical protein